MECFFPFKVCHLQFMIDLSYFIQIKFIVLYPYDKSYVKLLYFFIYFAVLCHFLAEDSIIHCFSQLFFRNDDLTSKNFPLRLQLNLCHSPTIHPPSMPSFPSSPHYLQSWYLISMTPCPQTAAKPRQIDVIRCDWIDQTMKCSNWAQSA